MYLVATIATPIVLYFSYKTYSLIKSISTINNKSFIHNFYTAIKAYTISKCTGIDYEMNVEKISNLLYELSFTIEGKKCKLIIKIIRGPRKKYIIYDENKVNITSKILPYLNLHFTPQNPTPKLLSHNKIILKEEDEEKIFVNNEELNVI